MPNKLILASKSPRRKELLMRIYPHHFDIIPSNIDESEIKYPSNELSAYYISYKKGEDISSKYKDAYVLCADTVVLINGEILGKPKNESEARKMLEEENENIQEVYTGFHIFLNGKAIASRNCLSKVILHNLTIEKIDEYIKTGSPFDKAGAYGIQDFQKKDYTILEGSFENIMGFPIYEIEEEFKKLNLL